MAPLPEDTVDNNLKAVIQDLYEIQSATHGYLGPETQQVLINKIHHLTTSLATLSTTSDALTTIVPPEIIEYIEDSRNPDIYTREFVELVQKGNVFLKGKSEAFAGFADVLGEEMEQAGMGRVEEGVEGVKKEGEGRVQGNGEVSQGVERKGDSGGGLDVKGA